MNLVTPQEMAAIDRATINDHGLPALALMESAARSVLPYIPPGPTQILVGPGNNGADGLVIARGLIEQGREVTAHLFAPPGSPELVTQHQLANNWGVPLFYHDKDSDSLPSFTDEGIIIDALFGTGLSRPLTGRYAQVLERANATLAQRFAVDIPSGIDGRTGQVLGAALKAHTTVTFGLVKWGQVLYPGKAHCGRLLLTQPGFHPQALRQNDSVVYLTPQVALNLLPTSWPTMHKGDNGRVLLVTGSDTYPGAGLLSLLGALRGGAGLVTHLGNKNLHQAALTLAPEALFIQSPPLDRLETFHALVLGCGLGPATETLGREVLKHFQGPAVIDADALRLVETFPRDQRSAWVLTPHPGELARLLKCSIQELEADRIASARHAAASLRAVVCFKGAPTVCASPDGRTYVNSSGNPGLSQGGSGDVLAGLLGAYLAFGLPLLEAAAIAVYVHGLASDLITLKGYPRGAGARHLAEAIPLAYTQASIPAQPETCRKSSSLLVS